MRQIAVLLCTALAAAALAAPAHGAEAPTHQLLFSLKGEIKEPGHVPIPPPEGELEDVCGVALDPAGDIYLADYYHRTIDIYGPGREYLTQIAIPGPNGPCGLAVDGNPGSPAFGDLYVEDWHGAVSRLAPSEFPPSPATSYGAPVTIDPIRSTGIALDPATGNLYVDERTSVAEFEPSGLPVSGGGSAVRIGLDPLASYYGLAISGFPGTEGDIYLADAAGRTVDVYEPGEPLAPVRRIDGAGTPPRSFPSLLDAGLAVDPTDGHLFVAENLEPGFEEPLAAIEEFNSAGAYRGRLPGTFVDAEPTGLALDAGGDVYVTDGNSEEASLEAFGPTAPAAGLEVAKTGTGEGTVTSEPAGIYCGAACAAEYNLGTEVALTAVPAPGSAFAGFSGGGCVGTAPCHLILAADTEVSARFEAVSSSEASTAQKDAGTLAPAAQALAAAPAAQATAHRTQHHRRRHHRHGAVAKRQVRR